MQPDLAGCGKHESESWLLVLSLGCEKFIVASLSTNLLISGGWLYLGSLWLYFRDAEFYMRQHSFFISLSCWIGKIHLL
jgi:hypothetical protein